MAEGETTQDRHSQGWALAHEGRYEEAVSLLQEAADSKPNDVDLWNLLGKTYYHLGRKKEAKHCWRRVLDQDPGDAVAYSCLHRAEAKNWKVVGAGLLGLLCGAGLVFFPCRVDRVEPGQEPGHATAPTAVPTVLPTAAPTAVSKAVPTVPPTAVPTLKKASTALPSPPPTPTAVSTPVGPAEPDAASLYGEAIQAFREQDLERCKELLSRLEDMELHMELRDNVLFWRGECLYVEKRYEEAKAYFERVLEETPGGSKALEAELLVAFCQMKTGPVEEAREVLEDSLEREDVPERLKDAARRALGR